MPLPIHVHLEVSCLELCITPRQHFEGPLLITCRCDLLLFQQGGCRAAQRPPRRICIGRVPECLTQAVSKLDEPWLLRWAAYRLLLLGSWIIERGSALS